VLATALGFVFNSYLLQYYTVTFLMFLTLVDPLYVALYGWLFIGERVSWYFFVSVLMLFFGLYLFYKEELKHSYLSDVARRAKTDIES
jgi:drug/metabolite transporter (DMT)-like permease